METSKFVCNEQSHGLTLFLNDIVDSLPYILIVP